MPCRTHSRPALWIDDQDEAALHAGKDGHQAVERAAEYVIKVGPPPSARFTSRRASRACTGVTEHRARREELRSSSDSRTVEKLSAISGGAGAWIAENQFVVDDLDHGFRLAAERPGTRRVSRR